MPDALQLMGVESGAKQSDAETPSKLYVGCKLGSYHHLLYFRDPSYCSVTAC